MTLFELRDKHPLGWCERDKTDIVKLLCVLDGWNLHFFTFKFWYLTQCLSHHLQRMRQKRGLTSAVSVLSTISVCLQVFRRSWNHEGHSETIIIISMTVI
jgi:hypothetical protein